MGYIHVVQITNHSHLIPVYYFIVYIDVIRGLMAKTCSTRSLDIFLYNIFSPFSGPLIALRKYKTVLLLSNW